MTTRTFTVPQVPGSGQSSTRILTHGIVASFDREAFMQDHAKTISQLDTRYEKGNFLDCMAVSLASDGAHLPCRHRPVTQAEIDTCKARMHISGGTWLGWLDMIRIDKTAAAHARLIREAQSPRVIHWSGSLANAEKSLRIYQKPIHFYTDVTIAECVMMKGK